MSEKLRHAAQVVLEHYLSCNPLRSADVHDARCGCTRCKMDYLSEALDEYPTSLEEVCAGIKNDYMTSEQHHPGYVLIPTKLFDAICEAGRSSDD